MAYNLFVYVHVYGVIFIDFNCLYYFCCFLPKILFNVLNLVDSDLNVLCIWKSCGIIYVWKNYGTKFPS